MSYITPKAPPSINPVTGDPVQEQYWLKGSSRQSILPPVVPPMKMPDLSATFGQLSHPLVVTEATESQVAKLRGDVLDRARQAVCVDRAKTHGDAEQSFETIAAYWSTHLGHPVSTLDVPIMMNLFKCARARSNPYHLDNYDDMAGYAAIGGQMAWGSNVPVRSE